MSGTHDLRHRPQVPFPPALGAELRIGAKGLHYWLIPPLSPREQEKRELESLRARLRLAQVRAVRF